MTEDGEKDSLFVWAEAVSPSSSAEGIGSLSVGGSNRTDGAEAKNAPNLLSGSTSNLHSEDMAEFLRKATAINYDNNSAPENVPRQGETTTGTGNWRRKGVIYPRKAGNIQKCFASFRHYSHDNVLCMSLLQLFLIMLPEEYMRKSSFLIPIRGLVYQWIFNSL